MENLFVMGIFLRYSPLELGMFWLVGFLLYGFSIYQTSRMFSTLTSEDEYISTLSNSTQSSGHTVDTSDVCFGSMIYTLFFVLFNLSPVAYDVTIFQYLSVVGIFGFLAGLIISDFRSGYLSIWTLISLLIWVSFSSYFFFQRQIFEILQVSLSGAAIILGISLIYYLFSGKHGFGFGDALFMLSCGAFLDFYYVLAVFGISIALMFPISVYILIRRTELKVFPFIPALAVSLFIVITYQASVTSLATWYLSQFSG